MTIEDELQAQVRASLDRIERGMLDYVDPAPEPVPLTVGHLLWVKDRITPTIVCHPDDEAAVRDQIGEERMLGVRVRLNAYVPRGHLLYKPMQGINPLTWPDPPEEQIKVIRLPGVA